MGRSYLSVKLAAVFGLVVAAAVTTQQQTVSERALEALDAMEIVVPVEALSELEVAVRSDVMAEIEAVRAAAMSEIGATIRAAALTEIEAAKHAVKSECDRVHATVLVHTPPARPLAPPAPAASRS